MANHSPKVPISRVAEISLKDFLVANQLTDAAKMGSLQLPARALKGALLRTTLTSQARRQRSVPNLEKRVLDVISASNGILTWLSGDAGDFGTAV